MLELSFKAEIIEWRGPAPFFFAPIPDEHTAAIRAAARLASYGWGCIPVTATVGGTDFTTSLMPKDGLYMLPLKNAIRIPLGLTVGDEVEIAIGIDALGSIEGFGH